MNFQALVWCNASHNHKHGSRFYKSAKSIQAVHLWVSLCRKAVARDLCDPTRRAMKITSKGWSFGWLIVIKASRICGIRKLKMTTWFNRCNKHDFGTLVTKTSRTMNPGRQDNFLRWESGRRQVRIAKFIFSSIHPV